MSVRSRPLEPVDENGHEVLQLLVAQDDGKLTNAVGGSLPDSFMLDLEQVTKTVHQWQFVLVDTGVLFVKESSKLLENLCQDLKTLLLDLFVALLESLGQLGVHSIDHLGG